MYLKKKDVSLYYEVRGNGEPLLLIHGVIVDAGLYERAAQLLSRYFRVITFDRRGNSRSRGEGELPFDMDEQAEDIRDLLDALEVTSAYVVGASAGAAIGQHFLLKYPRRVRHLVMYEPAILGYLRDEPEVDAWIREMLDLVERRRFNTVILKFVQSIASFDTRSPEKSMEMSLREIGNHPHALTREFPALVEYRPDIRKLREQADKVTIAAGEKSGGTIYVHGAKKLADAIGTQLLFFPGYHNLPYDLPVEFSICILGTLRMRAENPGSGGITE